MTDIRAALADCLSALKSEHGHGPDGGAPWPSCLPVHIAMNRARAALAAASPEPERCGAGVHAVHAGIPTVTDCGEPPDSVIHDRGHLDYDHPFQPASPEPERCDFDCDSCRAYHDQPAPVAPSAEALARDLMVALFTKWPEHGRKRMRDMVELALPGIIAAARADERSRL